MPGICGSRFRARKPLKGRSAPGSFSNSAEVMPAWPLDFSRPSRHDRDDVTTTPPALSAGATLAGYRIEAEVGRGGMGVVYRATQVTLDRTVALKLIAPESSRDERFRERFQREARIAASIDHPNVLPIYEAGEADGLLFLSMRYVEGGDLGALLEQGPLAPDRAVALVAQVAEALAAAHARGLIHRDVKPSNVLLEEREGQEQPYLADFGLAQVSASQSGLTKSGVFVGTLDY